MPRFAGKYGAINGHKSVRNWSVTKTNATRTYKASNTQAGTGRRAGVSDWTGNFAQLEPVPTVMAGDVFTFTGYLAPTSGVYNSVGPTRTGLAIVESNVITWDWENAEITSVINMACAGPLTNSTGTIVDSTHPKLYTTDGIWLRYSANLADLPTAIFASNIKFVNTTKAVLTITTTNPRFVDSDTGGWAGRTRGPLDWTLDITQNDIEETANLSIGTPVSIVLPVDATNYWALQFGQINNYTGVTVDNETGNIIQQTVNIGMLADSGTALGAIRLPGASSNWWPWTT